MPWIEATFKDGKVWVEVGPDGRLVEEAGRVPIRYSPKEGATIYRAGAARVSAAAGAKPVELPAGVSADSAESKPKSSSGRGSGFGSAGTRTQAQADSARSAAATLVAGFSAEAAICFTDGACKGNPGPAGSGAVVKLPDGRVLERSLALGVATNNVGELTAIKLALDLLDEAGFPTTAPAELLTDSQYATGVLSKNWKAKANQALITALKARLKTRRTRLHWIAGHVGIPENERADVLANAGVAESSRR